MIHLLLCRGLHDLVLGTAERSPSTFARTDSMDVARAPHAGLKVHGIGQAILLKSVDDDGYRDLSSSSGSKGALMPSFWQGSKCRTP